MVIIRNRVLGSLLLFTGVTLVLLAGSSAVFPVLAGEIQPLSGPPSFESGETDAAENATVENVQAASAQLVTVRNPVEVAVTEDHVDVGPDENGTVTVHVVNLHQEETTNVQIVVVEKPGVTVVDTIHENATVGPTSSRSWDFDVELTQGLHSVDIRVQYTLGDLEGSTTETAVFSKDAGEPTTLQRLFAFTTVSTYSAVGLGLITSWFRELNTSLFCTVFAIGLTIGAFVAATDLSREFVQSAVGTGFLVTTIVCVIFVILFGAFDRLVTVRRRDRAG